MRLLIKRLAARTGLAASIIALAGGYFSATLSIVAAPESPSFRYEAPALLTATIRDLTSTNVLFNFKRTATRSGTNLSVLCEYTYPDGTLAAREKLIYAGNRLISFSLDDKQSGANGGAKIRYDSTNNRSGEIEFTYQVKGGKPDKSVEVLTSDTLTSDMVGPFIRDHWEDLMKGLEIKCRYLVVPRRQTVGFTLSKQSETTWQGKQVVTIRMKASSWVVGLMIEPLAFVAERNPPHRVLQYTGRTTPRIKSDNAWKDLDAVTVFDWN